MECYAVADRPGSESVAQRVPVKRTDSGPLHGIFKGFGVAVVDRLAVILEDTTAIRRELDPIDPSARLQRLEPPLCVERLDSPQYVDGIRGKWHTVRAGTLHTARRYPRAPGLQINAIPSEAQHRPHA